MDRWDGHPGLRGSSDVLRVSAGLLDRGERQCADFAAVKVRARLWPKSYEPRRYAPLASFPLGLVNDALDVAEFDGLPVADAIARAVTQSRAAVHPGVAVWVRHACEAYLRASEWVAEELAAEGVEVVPESRPRVVQSGSAAEVRMLTAWGRWYTSRDGTVREFRRLRMSRTRDASAPSNLAVAFVAAAGYRAAGDLYRDAPVAVVPDEDAPTRIRVVEIALVAGTRPHVVVDAAPADVRRRYLEQVRPLVQGLTVGGDRRPGPECAECKLRSSCAELPHVPGLLGLEGSGTHRRTWSVTTGRNYLVCPARAHLRELHLPIEPYGDSPSSRRGVAVHQWLEAAHSRGRPCTAADLPSSGLGPAGAMMSAEEYREARPFLLAHLAVCPLTGPVTDVSAEPTVAAYDPNADVVVVAAPDLLRRVDGRLVYREQKTTSGALPAGDLTQLFAQFPQLALAVLLIRRGVLGKGEPGTVELEVMTPIHARVLSFDTTDPQVAAVAQRQITEMVGDWHRDVVFAANPGPWCAGCSVSRWCPSAGHSPGLGPIMVDGVRIDPRTGEILDAPGPLTERAAAVSDAIGDADEVEPPF